MRPFDEISYLSCRTITQLKERLLLFTIAPLEKEITQPQVEEVAKLIDSIYDEPAGLLVDRSNPHSVSFDGIIRSAKSKKLNAVALYAISGIAVVAATGWRSFIRLMGHVIRSGCFRIGGRLMSGCWDVCRYYEFSLIFLVFVR